MTTAAKIYGLLKPAQRKKASVLLGLMIVGMALETLGVALVLPAAALMTQPEAIARFPRVQQLVTAAGIHTQSQLVMAGMLALVVAYLVKNIFLAYLGLRQTRFAFGVQAEMSQRMFANFLAQPYTFHLQRNSAQLINTTITEVGGFTAVLTESMILTTEGLVLLGVGALLLAVQPLGAVVVVAVLGAASWTYHHATRTRVTRWGVARQYHEAMRIQHLQQSFGGVKEVKLLGRESEFLAAYEVHTQGSAAVAQYQSALKQYPRLWLELLTVMGLAILVMTMVTQSRSTAVIISTLALFAAAAFRLMPSVTRVLGAAHTLRYSLPIVDILHRELAAAVHVVRPQAKEKHARVLERDIRLTNVTFSYPDTTTPALDGIDVTIRKGESVGLIGTSGAGKSTMVDVVLGLLMPAAGEVLVDDENIQSRLRSWQDQIGYVPQTIYLTDDTLRRNVAFGITEDEIDDAAIARAIRAAQLEDFVGALEKGVETIVGERGVRLSGGQRQRIGIARALYHDPAVLVLDEATSALDMATEHEVMQAVKALQGTKTILVVAHRLSTVEYCSRLYRLENGRVIAQGSPRDLLVGVRRASSA